MDRDGAVQLQIVTTKVAAGLQNCVINIFQWNCNGLALSPSSLNELKQHLAYNYYYDVICLQETFLKPTKTFL